MMLSLLIVSKRHKPLTSLVIIHITESIKISVSPLDSSHAVNIDIQQFHLQYQYTTTQVMITLTARLTSQNQNGNQVLLSLIHEEKKEKTYLQSNKSRILKRKGQTTKNALRKYLGLVHKFSLWKLSENMAYMQFLNENEQLFYTSRSQRKSMKINVLMSQAIMTRSADQCRSHHQKMIKYHKDIPNIILHIRKLMKKENQSMESSKSDQDNIQSQAKPEVSDELYAESMKDKVIFPEYDFESWIYRNEVDEQDRLVELWLNGVEDKYGNL